MDILKRCTACGEEKSEYGFYLGRAGSVCKACHTAKQREKRRSNPEKSRENSQKNYWANKDKILARQKAARKKNKADPRRLEGVPEEKACRWCSKTKPAEAFYPNSDPGDGLSAVCRDCYRAKYQKKKEYWRDRYLRKAFGLTLERWNEMLTEQGNRCAACGAEAPGGRHARWHVDHSHKTGEIRALLCFVCNTALGMVDDSIPRLRSLIAYIEKHSKL